MNLSVDKIILAGNSAGGYLIGTLLARFQKAGYLAPETVFCRDNTILKISPYAVFFSCPVFPNYVTYNLPSYHDKRADLPVEAVLNYSLLAGLGYDFYKLPRSTRQYMIKLITQRIAWHIPDLLQYITHDQLNVNQNFLPEWIQDLRF